MTFPLGVRILSGWYWMPTTGRLVCSKLIISFCSSLLVMINSGEKFSVWTTQEWYLPTLILKGKWATLSYFLLSYLWQMCLSNPLKLILHYKSSPTILLIASLTPFCYFILTIFMTASQISLKLNCLYILDDAKHNSNK